MSVTVTGKTKIVGIYGCPAGHTLSPRMHNAAFQALKLDMIYLPFEVSRDSLKGAMEAVRLLNFIGVNLTHPHKVTALDYLDLLEDGARWIGAVNTVVNEGGTLIGHNTDGAGFVRSLGQDYQFDPSEKRIVAFGAGGAGRAICTALSSRKPKRLVIVEKIFERAQDLAVTVDGIPLRVDDSLLAEEISQADLVINATTGNLNLDTSWIPDKLFLYDIRYGREEAGLIREVQRRGGKAGDGRSMLLHQGALAFELWTGQKAPLKVMRKALTID